MQKETKKPKYRFIFKLFTILVLITALCLVYTEELICYLKHYNENTQKEEEKDVASQEGKENIATPEEEEASYSSLYGKAESHHSKVSNRAVVGKIDMYREHLWNFDQLAMKFFQRIAYSEELLYLEKHDRLYSTRIKAQLGLLKNFLDSYLIKPHPEYQNPVEEANITQKFLKKMVDIKQRNPQYGEMLSQYEKLRTVIPELAQYFYSREFLKRYLEDD